MEISTRNLGGLPDVAHLKRLLQSMAMLDAILEPRWEYRYYSFDAHWSKDQMMGSMRNGSGDEFYALFKTYGAFLKGFVHDSPAAGARIPSDCFYRGLPREFEECRRQPAFSTDYVTFCIWRLIDQPAWSYGKVDLPIPGDICIYEVADGSDSLLSILDGAPESYRAWASEYYERDVPIKAVEAIYRHQALTDELVATLNSQQSVKLLKDDTAKIAYAA